MMYVSLKQRYNQLYERLGYSHLSANFLPYCILGALFFINILVMWPGQMSPDSYTQYNAAIQGVFDDHHPPMMSLVWGFLDAIYQGPGLLFLMHILMLYGACVIFIASAQTKGLKLFYSVLPFIPHVLFYSSMLWKDVGFAFSFLLAVAILHYYMSAERRIDAWAAVAIVLLIFYGAAVKFQGQYIAPLVLIGLWHCLDSYRPSVTMIIKIAASCLAFSYALQIFNDYFVPPSRKAHSWQCVKIYDLAAMSVATGQPLFPEFLLQSPDFSMQEINARFNHKRVDDLFMPPSNPLRLGNDEAERNELLAYWQVTVWRNLPLYLHHRFINWWTMVTNMPLQRFETMDFNQFGGLQWFVALQKAAVQKQPITMSAKAMHYAGKLLNGFLYGLRYCFKFVFLIPFMLFYFTLGIVCYRRNKKGMSLILINALSIWFLGILFFCSMASDMRYAYIAGCMTHASHGIAWQLLRRRKGKDTLIAN